MKYAVLLLLFLLLLAGCLTPQQRLNRLLKKHPELVGDTTTTALVEARDTVLTVPADSASITLPDTTTRADVTRGRVRIRYVRLPGKSVYIDCRCDTTSVRLRTYRITVTKKYPVISVKEVPKPLTFWQKILAGLIVFGAFALGVFVTKTVNK